MPGIAPKRVFIPAAAVLVILALLAHVGWRGARAAAITVTTAVDETTTNGQCSLREAITNANNNAATFPDCAQGSGSDTISFQGGLSGTITLTSSQLPIITDALAINGPGAGILTVSGNNIFRVFEVGVGVSASISGLAIANGITVASGGGIFNAGTLTLANCTISSNIGIGGGGGVGNVGTLMLTNTTVTGNATSVGSGSGGGIRNEGSLTLTNSTVSGNAAADFGGGIFSSGSVTLTSSTVSGNRH